MIRKFFAAAVVLCMLFATACAPAPELMAFIGDENAEAGLDGLTLYFKASLGTPEGGTPSSGDLFLGYVQNTLFSDLARERVDQVEKALDVNIELSSECQDGISDIIFLMASGGGKMDANIGMDYEFPPMSKIHKAFLPMSAVSDYIDIYDSAKWGSPQRLEMFAWDGEIYGVIPNYWPELEFASSDFILVPNIDYIKSLNQDDPRDYFENGEWTLEKLKELIPVYANPQGGQEKMIYGYGFNNRHLYELLLIYYGADWVQKDDEGNWELGAYSDEGYLAAQACRDFQIGELGDLCAEGGVGDQATLWEDGRLAIATMHVVSMTDNGAITTAGYEYGVLPFPSQSGSDVFGQYERNVESIFITSFTTNAEATARVLSEIYEPFEGYEDDEALKAMYNNNIFFDPRDTEIIFRLADNVRVMYNSDDLSDINYLISDEVAKNEVASVLDKYRNKLDIVLVEDLIPIKETMEKLFPGYND